MNQVICRIIYWFFGLSYFFIILYPSIATSGGTVWWMGRPDLCGDREGGGGVFAQECSIYKTFQSSGHKIYTMTCRFMPYKVCFFREHSLPTFLTKHNMFQVPGQSEEACEAWSSPSHYLQLSTGWTASVLGAIIHKDLWFGCSQSSRWHSLNPHTDSVKALFSLLVDFGIDPLWSLLCTTGQDTSKNC